MLLGVALHDRGPGPHLRHDAPGTPHVHRRAVVPLSQEQLRRSVPESHHPVGVSVPSFSLTFPITSASA